MKALLGGVDSLGYFERLLDVQDGGWADVEGSPFECSGHLCRYAVRAARGETLLRICEDVPMTFFRFC